MRAPNSFVCSLLACVFGLVLAGPNTALANTTPPSLVTPANPSADFDEDGLTDADELLRGTNPNQPDTDGDGVADDVDGWPRDPAISPPRLADIRYSILPLRALIPSAQASIIPPANSNPIPLAIDDHGNVLVYIQDTQTAWEYNTGTLKRWNLATDSSISPVGRFSPTNRYTGCSPEEWNQWAMKISALYPTGSPQGIWVPQGFTLPPIFRLSYYPNQLLSDDGRVGYTKWNGDTFVGSFVSLDNAVHAVPLVAAADSTTGGERLHTASVTAWGPDGSFATVEQVQWRGTSAFYFDEEFLVSAYKHSASGTAPIDSTIRWKTEGWPNTTRIVSGSAFIPYVLGCGDVAVGALLRPSGQYYYVEPQQNAVWIGGQSRQVRDDFPNAPHIGKTSVISGATGAPEDIILQEFAPFEPSFWLADLDGNGYAWHPLQVWDPKTQAPWRRSLTQGNQRFEMIGHGLAVVRNGTSLSLAESISRDWNLSALSDINNQGLILATAQYTRDASGQSIPAAQQVIEPVLLIPAALTVDADRDGALDEQDMTVNSSSKPFSFWSNDDDDGIFSSAQETEEDDLEITDTQQEDWRNNVIDVARDLEDCARLQLNIGGLHDAFKNGQLYLGFKWSDTNGTNPAIKLYRATDPDGGTGYLNDPTAANTQSFQVAIVDARHPAYSGPPWASDYTVVGTGDFFVLPTLQSINLSASNPTLRFIFEGCTTGQGQLKLVILKQVNGTFTEIGEGPGVWLDIKKPHEFIQRWTCGNGSLAAVQPVQFEAGKSGFFAAPVKEEEKDLVLYVHGYNMLADWEKQRWIETTYKRLYWLGYKGRVGGFSWPCVLDDGAKFNASEELAWQSGAELHSLLGTLKQQGYRVHLLGHSMGNIVIGEALRLAGPNSELVTTYVASQAAIAAHCYDASLPDRSGPNAFTPTTPNVYARYWTDIQDANLPETWGSLSPSYLAPTYTQGAARKFVNFYNPLDWALRGNGLNILPSADDGSQTGWLTNQRLKPGLDGYDYVSYGGFRESPLTHVNPRWLGFPADRFTIFAYCAEARSVALGMTSTGGVFSSSNVDLNSAPCEFLNQHIYHSAQFRSFYAQRWQYWQRLMNECDFDPREKP